MAAGNNSTHQNLRKALGALKDSTKVGLAKVNSENKDLDIAIVKATNHLEVPPKEKHVRTIFEALSRPRADFPYCMHALAKRLAKTSTWTVALKTLIIIHRALREMVPPIHQELVSYSQSRVLVLNMSHFKDESTPNAWYYSSWVRYYALYLEERLENFRIVNYDVIKDSSRTKKLDIQDLLDQLPALQQLLFRLLACQPEGVTRYNFLIQYTLSIVAAESVHIYVAITAGNLNLVDKFFEMKRHDAVRSLEIYRKATYQAEKLSEFFEICRGLEFGSRQKYIKIHQAPASFLKAMMEYVKEAPQSLVLPRKGNSDETRTPARDSASSAPDFRTPLPRSFHCSDEPSTPPRDSASSSPDFRTPFPRSFHCSDETNTPPRDSASSAPDFRTPLPRSFFHLSDSDEMGTTKLTASSSFSFQTDLRQGVNVGKKGISTPQVTNLLGLDNSTHESFKMDDRSRCLFYQGLDISTHESSIMEDGNALAHEIANSDDLPSYFNISDPSSQSSSWALELVATPSTSGVSVDDYKAGGLETPDRLTLNSLYDNAVATANQNETQQMEPPASHPSENAQFAQEDSTAEKQQQPFVVDDDPTKGTIASNPFESIQSSLDNQLGTEIAEQQPVADNQNPGNPFI